VENVFDGAGSVTDDLARVVSNLADDALKGALNGAKFLVQAAKVTARFTAKRVSGARSVISKYRARRNARLKKRRDDRDLELEDRRRQNRNDNLDEVNRPKRESRLRKNRKEEKERRKKKKEDRELQKQNKARLAKKAPKKDRYDSNKKLLKRKKGKKLGKKYMLLAVAGLFKDALGNLLLLIWTLGTLFVQFIYFYATNDSEPVEPKPKKTIRVAPQPVSNEGTRKPFINVGYTN
jgi:hypothetical protein